jgi:hypothetical protein
VKLANNNALTESKDTEELIYKDSESKYKKDKYKLVSKNSTKDNESKYKKDKYKLVSKDGIKNNESK